MARTDAPPVVAPAAAPLTEVDELRAQVKALEERELKHWKLVENFLAKFGTYYNTAGQQAMFIVNALVTSGANGVALTPNQGMIEKFGLPIKMERATPGEKLDELYSQGYWVPEIIPEQTKEEIVELFNAE